MHLGQGNDMLNVGALVIVFPTRIVTKCTYIGFQCCLSSIESESLSIELDHYGKRYNPNHTKNDSKRHTKNDRKRCIELLKIDE